MSIEYKIPPTHCGGSKYFAPIEDMKREDPFPDERNELDEFVHWSDYDDLSEEVSDLRATNAALAEELARVKELEASPQRVLGRSFEYTRDLEAKRDELKAHIERLNVDYEDVVARAEAAEAMLQGQVAATDAALEQRDRAYEQAESAESQLKEVESGIGVQQFRRLEAKLREAASRYARVGRGGVDECICEHRRMYRRRTQPERSSAYRQGAVKVRSRGRSHGDYHFRGVWNGSLRAGDGGAHRLVLAYIDGHVDGGDGAARQDDDGLLRGE